MKNPAARRRSLRRWITLALIPIAGITLASAPDASANGFHKNKSFHHSSHFKRSGFKFNHFQRRSFRSFHRSSSRSHFGQRSIHFNQSRFDRHRFHSRPFHRSANFASAQSGFGFDGPATFRRDAPHIVDGTNFIDRRFTPDRTRPTFAPTPALAPEYRIAPPPDQRAWDLLAAERYSQAQLAFGRLATASPDNPEFKIGFALASAALGQYDRAESAFARAERLQPGDTDRANAAAFAQDLLRDDLPLPDALAASLQKIADTPQTTGYAEHADGPAM